MGLDDNHIITPSNGEIPEPDNADAPDDSGLICLAMMAKVFDHAINPEQIAHTRGKKNQRLDENDIILAARDTGLKAKASDTSWERLGDPVNLPCIAMRDDGSFLIIAKMGDGEKKGFVLVHDPLVGRPEEYSREQLETVWSGRVLRITSRKGLTGEDRRFDVSWFILTIIKYRHVFGEVGQCWPANQGVADGISRPIPGWQFAQLVFEPGLQVVDDRL